MGRENKMVRFKMIKTTCWFILLILFFTVSSAQARYTGFWRNAFESKSSWLENHTDEQYWKGAEHLILSQFVTAMCGVSLAPSAIPLVQMHDNAMNDAINEIIAGTAAAVLIPSAPTITRIEPSENGLEIYFSYHGRYSSRMRYFTLYYFENGMEAPRIVSPYNYPGYGNHDPELPILDPDPPTSGAGFYAMTTTTGSNPTNMASNNWWSLNFSGSMPGSIYQQYLARKSLGWNSDYSAPYIYNAFPTPENGGIDAIAVHPGTGDVYVSKPEENTIYKITNSGDILSQPEQFVGTGFAAPGHKGLAIDANGNLFTDNAASDAMYGGRLFKFTSAGSRSFTGSINYFSQLLMFANPVAAGPMTMGNDNQLYVFDAISREIKQVPVNATYDPYRRVGHMYYGYTDTESANVIDLDCGAGNLFGPEFLYILDNNSIKGLPLGLSSGVLGIAYDMIPLE